MPYHNALSLKEKRPNTKSTKSSNNQDRALKVSIPLATATLCLLNPHQKVLATDFNTQTAADKVTFSHSTLDRHHEKHSFHECQHDHDASGLLPRILSLIPVPFKNYFANLSQSQESQIVLNSHGRGGSLVKHLTPIYLSQAENNSEREFLATTKIKTIQPAVNNTFSSKSQTHIVKTGDTINRIAKKYQVSRQDLIALNKIKNSNIIFVNQKLIIPATKQNTVGTEKISLTAINLPQSAGEKAASFSPQSNYVANAKLNSEDIAKFNSNTNASAAISDEDRLARLRKDIEQMRSQYQNQIEQETENNQTESHKNKFNSSPNQVDVATSTNLEKNQDLDSISQEVVALQLPPLPSSEEYLPEAFDGYVWPAQGVLTSGYGWRWGRLHKGIDIAAPVGTPVFAAAAGEVVSAGWNTGGYGYLIELQHLDGSITLYAHNNKILVNQGQKIRQGEQIAEMGNTGFSTGSHLHFEIHSKNKSVVNPLALLSRR
ncbi:peptidoglycan DD-metalloendopeptidase family protein [Waterburya agarophytonicola K14]|uniref:Peptidoglycan DD-metalloendopeptidase family protein n=1 Tax=Waterburya agarophytonicola KI4 TaxID=2874699 RepID=A0A964BQR2_9CYAN|nr:peptidoglycan DD-metalloendopeptidase family protein [Waterburya agarophytonicola]MCC0177888.1 peptidoglycan DD-metalloendopeptidase family protein [Waterburya agarophytonicola KI4]